MTLRMPELTGRSLALGTAGLAFREVTDDEALATIRTAYENGVSMVDTALAYSRPGDLSTAETFVGRALREFGRDAFFVSTKGGHWRQGDVFPVDGRPETLKRHCEVSLGALGVTEIDLYSLHHVDPDTPIAESVGALRELQLAGTIRHIGLSNVTAAQLGEASEVATIAAVQNRLALTAPDDLPMAWECARRGITYLAYMPLGGPGARPPEAVDQIARARGVSAAQVLLAWARAQASTVVPVFGASRPETARDSAGAAALHLDADELNALHRPDAGVEAIRPTATDEDPA